MKLYYILLFSLFLNASLWAGIERVKGTILYGDREEEVTLEIPTILFNAKEVNYIKLQQKLKYYTEQEKKKVLRPKDNIVGFKFRFQDEEIEMRKVYPNYTKLFAFYRIVKDGEIQLYRRYYIKRESFGTGGVHGSFSSAKQVHQPFILRKGQPLVRIEKSSFRKNMKNYFLDCPVLTEKIKSREFNHKNIPQMIQFYYRNCK